MDRNRIAAAARALAVRTLLLAPLWWAMTEGEVGAPGPAILAVLAAAAASLVPVPPGAFRWSVAGLLRFLPFFLAESARGGVDVAWRALHPRLPIRPGLTTYRLALQEEPARVFFANTVSLLPGTLSCELDGSELRVHLLDRDSPAAERLQRLEARVAALFAPGAVTPAPPRAAGPPPPAPDRGRPG